MVPEFRAEALHDRRDGITAELEEFGLESFYARGLARVEAGDCRGDLCQRGSRAGDGATPSVCLTGVRECDHFRHERAVRGAGRGEQSAEVVVSLRFGISAVVLGHWLSCVGELADDI